MRSKREGDFESTIQQLVQLLKQMLKNYPDEIKFAKQKPFISDQGMNVNFIFMNILPWVDEEDWAEVAGLEDSFNPHSSGGSQRK